MINSFVKNPTYLQKCSDGNFLVTHTLGLTSPLFAQAESIYFSLWCIVQLPLKAIAVVNKLWEQIFDGSQDRINEWGQPAVSGLPDGIMAGRN